MQRKPLSGTPGPLVVFNRSSATSLYATTAETPDQLRGPGQFQSLKRDIPLCNRVGIRMQIGRWQCFNRSSATSLYATLSHEVAKERRFVCFNRSSATSLYAT